MTRTVLEPEPASAPPPPRAAPNAGVRRRAARGPASLLAQGQSMIWLTGGALSVCLLMIAGFLLLVFAQGALTFWPRALVEVERIDGGALLGEVTRSEQFTPGENALAPLPPDIRAEVEARVERGETVRRRLLRTGNFELTNEHFHWVSDHEIVAEERPEWAVLFEREAWGRFYGTPVAYLLDGEPEAESPESAWESFERHHGDVRARRKEVHRLETGELGDVNRRQEEARLARRRAVLAHGQDSPEARVAEQRFVEVEAAAREEHARIQERISELDRENERHALVVRTAAGEEQPIALGEIVRAHAPNRLSFGEEVAVYISRWWEFLTAEPREANSEGGVFPAIFGTVMMTLIMTVIVVPFGVLAALYLREYAKAGPMISAVRIAVNNLAGVPSIVFGVFGLGFFCYLMGGTIDEVLFAEKLPTPTFGTGGILWASLTLALLTLPVVIVATEEALAAVPRSMREGSYACGASTWQTIRRIVLPRAMPGIMTGAILAMARGAGEVAPLMLVGAVKLAPELPFDSQFPWFHLERSFMHLGFHIYDLGFQSQNSEAAKPMVFTTTLLLIALIALLNLTAVHLRTRLRRRFVANQF